jgi:hypothetical protein
MDLLEVSTAPQDAAAQGSKQHHNSNNNNNTIQLTENHKA